VLQELFFLLVVFISLGAGIGAVLLINQMKNIYQLDYLFDYLYNQIMRFVFGIYGLIGLAVVTWIFREADTPSQTVKTVISFIPYLGVPFIVAAWYLFVKVSVEIVGKKVTNKMTFAYFMTILLVILTYGYLLVYQLREQPEKIQLLSDNAKYVFLGLEGVTLLIAFYFLYVGGSKMKHAGNRLAVRNFAHLKFIFSVLGIVLFFLAEDNLFLAAAYILVFFAGDLPAILYLGNYLNRNYLTGSGKTEAISPYADFITNYKISKREWEIVEKIGEGMTNRQISETLFISLQTVKDHTHRIYKKTGVKNRVQLVNMIGSIRR
jgi:DNA-binding CsgD family transcriptional regulator